MSLNIKNIFYISLFFHIVAAIFSSGFQHFDEHFQIYEFLNFKLGNISSSNLPWEFKEQIRPWFQVFTYFGVHKVLEVFGVTSPFIFAFIIRLFTSLLGLFALTSLIPLLKQWIPEKKYQIMTWGFLNLCWFVPYIQTRTSSESFGISFFLLGMSCFITSIESKSNYIKSGLTAGLFFGLSYLSRSPMAIMVASLWFWSIFIKKSNFRVLLSSSIAIILTIGLGVLFDYWGYGNWTFSTWNYFEANFLNDALSSFGVHPWWWYFRLALNRGIAPVSLPLLFVTLWGWWKYQNHPLTWVTLSLFSFHSYVGHKELRFIFPIIILVPIYLGFFLRDYSEKVEVLYKRKSIRFLWKLVLTVNFLFLIVGTFRAANPSVDFYQFIWNQSEIEELNVYGENPYTMLGLPLEFYKKKDLKINMLDTYPVIGYVFFNKGKFVKEMEEFDQCELIYLTYPKWVLKFNIGNWISRSRVWSLYKCKEIKKEEI